MSLSDLHQNKDKYISQLQQESKNKEDQLKAKINDLQNKFENTMNNTKDTEERCVKLEKELLEIVN